MLLDTRPDDFAAKLGRFLDELLASRRRKKKTCKRGI
jgi:hypothetical protein